VKKFNHYFLNGALAITKIILRQERQLPWTHHHDHHYHRHHHRHKLSKNAQIDETEPK